ncbi:MAG: hypothetical protein ACD_15C00162G0003 [uncultured bacterium]|nr:MAG: hypothetical protein ACD_15C00162G0003 [uncultured bacterium]HCU70324.1 UDP-glucose 6-dehydrogenase [Candidatus Moranbacteria bacterium]
MKITVVGIGFVGLPLAAAFASMGNQVYCLDNDIEKIENLKKGIMPISEPGLDGLVMEGMKHNLLNFTNDYDEALADCEILFIAVGTPPGDDGSADLRYVESVAHTIGRKIARPLIVVDKSTVPVGTAAFVHKAIQEELEKRKTSVDFWVVSNPEFMAEGRAVKDMLEPSRVVVGSDNDQVIEKMRLLYDPFMKKTPRFHAMGVSAAELTKYASNTMLALKISFINTVAGLSDLISADVEEVAEGMGSDPRIGPEFLHASLGYGGSCFPKDVKAIIFFAQKIGLPKPYINLLKSIEEVNNYQKTVVPRKVVARFGENLKGKKFALWGLSFKAKTNDMRESAAIDIVKHLTAHGAEIAAYDPLAIEEAKTVYLKEFKDVSYEKNDKYKILDGCEALIIVTETGEYRTIDADAVKKSLKNPVIIDGRNLLDIPTLKKAGFEYYAIGRGDALDWQNIVLKLEQ